MTSGYTQELADGYSLRIEHWRIADADPERQQVRVHLLLDGADVQYPTITVAADATDEDVFSSVMESLTAAAAAHAEASLLDGLVGEVL